MGEEKISLYSSTTLSTFFCNTREPFLGAMDVATISPLVWDKNRKKTNFIVWEMILLHFLVDIKEMVVGRATSGILYSFLPKVIIIVWVWTHTQHQAFTRMVGLIKHQRLQDEQHHTIPHPWRDWFYREGAIVVWHKDLILGEATWWCIIAGVVWLVGPFA